MLTYASDLFDTVKDARIEGTVVYHGLYRPASPGNALSIAASGYTVAVWLGLGGRPDCGERAGVVGSYSPHDAGEVSNRRDHYSAGAFLHPDPHRAYLGSPDGGIVSGGATGLNIGGAQRGDGVQRPGHLRRSTTGYLPSMADYGLGTQTMGDYSKQLKQERAADRSRWTQPSLAKPSRGRPTCRAGRTVEADQ